MLTGFYHYRYIRSLLLLRSANNAIALSMPALASVVAFASYSLTGHKLEAAVIFSSLTLFNLLRLPLMFLRTFLYKYTYDIKPLTCPVAVSFGAITDAANATGRLYDVFIAETLEETHTTELDLPVAIEVRDGAFTWDSPPPETKDTKKRKRHSKGAASKKPTPDQQQPAAPAQTDEENVFKMKDINLSIPRGQLVAIVGPVGTGKTSLLQGVIGEMRKTSGTIKFGGSVGYCPQTAWIQVTELVSGCCCGI